MCQQEEGPRNTAGHFFSASEAALGLSEDGTRGLRAWETGDVSLREFLLTWLCDQWVGWKGSVGWEYHKTCISPPPPPPQSPSPSQLLARFLKYEIEAKRTAAMASVPEKEHGGGRCSQEKRELHREVSVQQ